VFVAAVRALPTEIKVESGTSQSKSRTSVNLGERVRIGWFNGLLIYHFHMGTSPSTWIYKYNSRDLVFERREHSEEVREPVPVGHARPGSEAGSYFRLIDSCITQLKAQGPSRTCDESQEEEEETWVRAWSAGVTCSGLEIEG
jgi:hypothetical protein